MDEKIYKITLADGTVLADHRINGNNYIAPSILDDSVFDGNLVTVTIYDGEVVDTHENMVLIQLTSYGDGKSWFVLEDRVPGVVYEPVTLSDIKAARIALSKKLLAEYLESHPITSTAHGGKAELYSATSEKQGYLQGRIMMASAVPGYVPTWNAAGMPCEPWDIAELVQLAGEMDHYVTRIVAYQQAREMDITACKTAEEVQAVEINYSAALEGAGHE
jgi:hypothetical protein